MLLPQPSLTIWTNFDIACQSIFWEEELLFIASLNSKEKWTMRSSDLSHSLLRSSFVGCAYSSQNFPLPTWRQHQFPPFHHPPWFQNVSAQLVTSKDLQSSQTKDHILSKEWDPSGQQPGLQPRPGKCLFCALNNSAERGWSLETIDWSRKSKTYKFPISRMK